MKNDEVIKTLSSELLKGAKMLSTHCSKCGYPLFEKNGRIYCPVCEKLKNEEIIEKSEKEKEIESKSDIKKIETNEMSNLNDALNEKMDYLIMKLKEETEISRIKEIAEAIYMLIKIRKKIE